MTDVGEDDLLDLLDGAAAAALVREVPDVAGRWSFLQALTQHTLYQDLGATRRARAHRQVAEALEAMCGDHPGPRVGELAHHWFSATQPVNTVKAISYARQAAEAALAALAPDDAVRYFSQALQLIALTPGGDPLLDCDLRIGLAEAQRQAGFAAFRETFLDAAQRARALGATDRLVASALGNSRGFFSAAGVIDTDKVSVLEAALEALPSDDSPQRAMLLATLCSEFAYGTTLERRRALADEARAMARRLGDPATIIRVLNLVGDPLQVPSALDERVADTAEALALAEALGDPDPLFHAAIYAHLTAVQTGDFDLAAQCLETMRTLSDRLRQPALMWSATSQEAGHATLTGDPEQAEQLTASALQMGIDSGQPDAMLFYAGQLLVVREQQGRLGELVPMIEEAAAENANLSALRAALTAAQIQAGDNDRARQLLDADATDGFAFLPQDILWMGTVTSYAGVAIELRAGGPAQHLYQLLTRYHERIPFVISANPPVASFLGGLASVLDRYDEAEAYFAEATEINTRGQMKYAAAYTQLEWGRMLVARARPGDLDRARTLLEHARDAAVAHGYAMVERRAATELSNLT